jgi:hypothetical protein
LTRYATGEPSLLRSRRPHHLLTASTRSYEAWVLYNFLSLCLAYVGGPGAVVNQAEGKIIQPSWSWGTCCLPPLPIDGFFLRRCKQGTLQFVLIKPVLASLTLILYAAERYEDGVWDPAQGCASRRGGCCGDGER